MLHAIALVIHALTILAGLGTLLDGVPLSGRDRSLALILSGLASALLRVLTMAFPSVQPADDSAQS
jgi:hypothetical protein